MGNMVFFHIDKRYNPQWLHNVINLHITDRIASNNLGVFIIPLSGIIIPLLGLNR